MALRFSCGCGSNLHPRFPVWEWQEPPIVVYFKGVYFFGIFWIFTSATRASAFWPTAMFWSFIATPSATPCHCSWPFPVPVPLFGPALVRPSEDLDRWRAGSQHSCYAGTLQRWSKELWSDANDHWGDWQGKWKLPFVCLPTVDPTIQVCYFVRYVVNIIQCSAQSKCRFQKSFEFIYNNFLCSWKLRGLSQFSFRVGL